MKVICKVLVYIGIVVATVFVLMMFTTLPNFIADPLIDSKKPARERVKVAEDAIRYEKSQPVPDIDRINQWQRELYRANEVLAK